MNSERWVQREVFLRPQRRGIHLITNEILAQIPELESFEVGTAHFFLMHTSAGLALNERVEPEVRRDLNAYFDRAVPEESRLYEHGYEGSDDMPAHIKSVLTSVSLTVPISDGALRLGTWQGIYLCEFRNRGGARRLTATLHGTVRD